MPQTPDAYTSFLVALRDAYSAGGAAPSAFRPGAQGISPFGAGAGSDGPGIPGIPGGGAGGGTVPGTAITGANLLEGILGGGPAGSSLEQRVSALRGGGQSDPSGISTGEFDNLQGGDLDMLSSILQFGPLAVPLILGQLAFGDAAGPSGFGADATGGDPFVFGGPAPAGLDLGGATAGVDFGSNPFNPAGGLSFGGGGGGSDGSLSFGGGGGNSSQFDTPEFGV